MKYYTYKITFKDLPKYFYYGYHKHRNDIDSYFGTPTTWKHLWDSFSPEKQILQWYETWEEAKESEDAIIKATWKNPYSLNENAGGNLSPLACQKGGLITGNKHKKEGTGFFSMTKEEWSKAGRAGGKASSGGKKTVELGVGIHTFESRSKGGKKGGPIGGKKSRPSEEGRKRLAESARKNHEKYPEQIKKFSEAGQQARRKMILVKDLILGQERVFDSQTQACNYLNLKAASVSLAVNKGLIHKGYSFERYEK